MELLPESIQGVNTLALDKTFLNRLQAIGIPQLAIDFSNEKDMLKLSLWLEQFGIPLELLPNNMNELVLRDLLQLTFRIYKLSGTEASIKLLATALGADNVNIIMDAFTLDHNRQAVYDSTFIYNKGSEFKSFAVDVFGIDNLAQKDFIDSFRKLFEVFQPIHLYLRNVVIEPPVE